MYRKDAVAVAVLGLLASAGFAMADTTPGLSLKPVVTADATTAAAPAAADRAPLMMLLDKAGAGASLDKLGINIYGFVESGYTYLHRHHSNDAPIQPGPFNHEVGNHYMLNQLDLRFERTVDNSKWDVGGMVELMYGTDAAGIHSNGLEYGNSGTEDRYHPQYQFDITQAYVDINIPVGNGLVIRAGKFVALAGYETIDPRPNPFYSHSYLFSAVPGTQTGILGMYKINEQWSATFGISRGWDQATEDNNGAIDVLGQIAYTPNKQWSVYLNFITGPENTGDTSHYRTLINPIINWQVTDKLKLGLEGLYVYDGGINVEESGSTHAYGDRWGAAFYASYVLCDVATLNLRAEKLHNYDDSVVDFSDRLGTDPAVPTVNLYEITLGVTLTPFPKDPIGKNLSFRPEIRYDFTDGDKVYSAGGTTFKDQLTFAADVIFKF